jgi:hypothetical protein
MHNYIHDFHADREHAMCNIQNRPILVVQLAQVQKLSTKDFDGTTPRRGSFRRTKCGPLNSASGCDESLFFTAVAAAAIPSQPMS